MLEACQASHLPAAQTPLVRGITWMASSLLRTAAKSAQARVQPLRDQIKSRAE